MEKFPANDISFQENSETQEKNNFVENSPANELSKQEFLENQQKNKMDNQKIHVDN